MAPQHLFWHPPWGKGLQPQSIEGSPASQPAAAAASPFSSSSSSSASCLLPRLSTTRPTGSATMRFSFLVAFGIFLAWAEARKSGGHHPHAHCLETDSLQEGEVPMLFRSKAARWKRHAALRLVPYLENSPAGGSRHRRHHQPTCPDFKRKEVLNKEVNERSISPWKYTVNEDVDRYPRKLAFAECLCNNCIDTRTGEETRALNSVLVYQNVMVLRRKLCQREDDTESFSFEVEYIRVPVACTCVLPQSNS